MRTLVLCSGGLDSVVAAALLKSQGDDVAFLYISYGSQAADKETKAVTECGTLMDIPTATLLSVCSVWPSSSGMIDATQDPGGSNLAGDAAWVPCRNLVLLSLATAYAVVHKFDAIAIGNIADGIYADNKAEFTNRFNEVLPYATAPEQVICLAPLVHHTKADVIKLGLSLNVPFELTWSCYRSTGQHCGQCGSCLSRRRAFARIGEVDPVPYENYDNLCEMKP